MRTELELASLTSVEAYAAYPTLASQLRLPWFAPPRIDDRIVYSTRPAQYTAVLPVFNQQEILGRFAQAHFANAVAQHDVVVIFDCCTDESRATFLQAVREFKTARLSSLLMVSTPVPYFETACDNLGFMLADTPLIIEYQPDLMMATHAYDARLLSALSDPRVFCASGRCGHSLRDAYPASRRPWPLAWMRRLRARCDRIGLTGARLEKMGLQVDDTRPIGYLCETVNRGPVAFRSRDLRALGLLDQANFFLGGDDHDLNLRAFLATGMLPAYVPIRVGSKLSDGSTRKPRDALNARIFKSLSERSDHSVLRRFEGFYRPYCRPTPIRLEQPGRNGSAISESTPRAPDQSGESALLDKTRSMRE